MRFRSNSGKVGVGHATLGTGKRREQQKLQIATVNIAEYSLVKGLRSGYWWASCFGQESLARLSNYTCAGISMYFRGFDLVWLSGLRVSLFAGLGSWGAVWIDFSFAWTLLIEHWPRRLSWGMGLRAESWHRQSERVPTIQPKRQAWACSSTRSSWAVSLTHHWPYTVGISLSRFLNGSIVHQ